MKNILKCICIATDVQKKPSLLLWGSIGTAIVIIVWAVVVFMKRKKKS